MRTLAERVRDRITIYEAAGQETDLAISRTMSADVPMVEEELMRLIRLRWLYRMQVQDLKDLLGGDGNGKELVAE